MVQNYLYEIKNSIITNLTSQFTDLTIGDDTLILQDYPISDYKMCRVRTNLRQDSQQLSYVGDITITLIYKNPYGIAEKLDQILTYLMFQSDPETGKLVDKKWQTEHRGYQLLYKNYNDTLAIHAEDIDEVMQSANLRIRIW